ncbi:hypothetical protein HDU84_001890 [Entophlyctis sp. JEL0112]|nr:hypothetical protein HDU84_001890 [Entophlyctis sp. JEL0112]
MSVAAFEHLYALHPDELPSRAGVHPFLLIRADAVEREIGDDDCLHKELYVHNDKSIDGVFLSESDASYLGLTEVGIADTVFGRVTRWVCNGLLFHFKRESLGFPISGMQSHPAHFGLPIENVYGLPKQFAGTYLGDGIIGLNVLLGLGVSVAFDRGYVYLVKNGFEQHILGSDRPLDKAKDSEATEGPAGIAKDIWAGLGISLGVSDGSLSDGDESLGSEDAASSPDV